MDKKKLILLIIVFIIVLAIMCKFNFSFTDLVRDVGKEIGIKM